MPPRKRARSSPGSSSSDAAPLVELDGGPPFPPKVVSLWRGGHSDITVKVQGTDFAAHKLVLEAGSTYFEGLFQSERSDANAPSLAEMPAAAFEPLLQYLYEGRCSCDQGLLTPLLRAASYLGVKPLELSIGTALQARLLPSNAFALWTLAEEAVLPLLEEAAKSVALAKFEEVQESLAEEASWDQVHALVESDQLAARSEEAVFEAVVRYAEAQRPEEERLLALMRHVRFPLMRREFLQQTIYSWPMLDTKAGLIVLRDAFEPFAYGGGCVPRVGFGPRLLYVMGGTGSDNNVLASVEIFDPQTNGWTAGMALPEGRSEVAAAILEGKIYLVGGEGGSSKVEAFDPQAGAWAEVARMPTGREELTAAVVGGRLFAIGGIGGGNCLSTVEAFDPQTGVWAALAPMPTARYGAGAAVLDGKIYVVGGINGTGRGVVGLATVEVYDPATNAWSQAPPMGTARATLGVAALGGKLYAAGGWDGDTLSSVEVFDPQTNVWTPLTPMSTSRSAFAMAAVQGKLYAAGGYDGSGAVASAEAFDPQQNRWEAVAPLAQARDSFCAVPI